MEYLSRRFQASLKVYFLVIAPIFLVVILIFPYSKKILIPVSLKNSELNTICRAECKGFLHLSKPPSKDALDALDVKYLDTILTITHRNWSTKFCLKKCMDLLRYIESSVLTDKNTLISSECFPPNLISDVQVINNEISSLLKLQNQKKIVSMRGLYEMRDSISLDQAKLLSKKSNLLKQSIILEKLDSLRASLLEESGYLPKSDIDSKSKLIIATKLKLLANRMDSLNNIKIETNKIQQIKSDKLENETFIDIQKEIIISRTKDLREKLFNSFSPCTFVAPTNGSFHPFFTQDSVFVNIGDPIGYFYSMSNASDFGFKANIPLQYYHLISISDTVIMEYYYPGEPFPKRRKIKFDFIAPFPDSSLKYTSYLSLIEPTNKDDNPIHGFDHSIILSSERHSILNGMLSKHSSDNQ